MPMTMAGEIVIQMNNWEDWVATKARLEAALQRCERCGDRIYPQDLVLGRRWDRTLVYRCRSCWVRELEAIRATYRMPSEALEADARDRE